MIEIEIKPNIKISYKLGDIFDIKCSIDTNALIFVFLASENALS